MQSGRAGTGQYGQNQTRAAIHGRHHVEEVEARQYGVRHRSVGRSEQHVQYAGYDEYLLQEQHGGHHPHRRDQSRRAEPRIPDDPMCEVDESRGSNHSFVQSLGSQIATLSGRRHPVILYGHSALCLVAETAS